MNMDLELVVNLISVFVISLAAYILFLDCLILTNKEQVKILYAKFYLKSRYLVKFFGVLSSAFLLYALNKILGLVSFLNNIEYVPSFVELAFSVLIFLAIFFVHKVFSE